MPIPVRIVLTVQGANTGPFALYTDLDGYTTPFDSNGGSGIPGAWFAAPNGYLASVPEGTSIIRVCNYNNPLCDNCIDLDCLSTTTSSSTTTTTTTTSEPYPPPPPPDPTTTTTTTVDCVVLQVNITQEMLDDATGNEYESWNNTVFLYHVPCGYPIGRRTYSIYGFITPGYRELCIVSGSVVDLYYYKNEVGIRPGTYTVTGTPCEQGEYGYDPITTTTSTTVIV